MKKLITFYLTIIFVTACSPEQIPKPGGMTVDEAFGYVTTPSNNCKELKAEYCEYANNIYNTANTKVQNEVLKDSVIRKLLTQAQSIDCYHSYPEPALCMAIDARAVEVEMDVIKKLNISTTNPIFDVNSSSIQGGFNQEQRDKEALKRLKQASESLNIQ